MPKPGKSSKARLAPATARFSAKEAAAITAATERGESRTPGAVLDAFFPPKIPVGTLQLREFSLGDFMLLEKIGSPLIEAEAEGQPTPTLLDFTLGVMALALPAGEARAILLRSGKEGLVEQAELFAYRVPAGELMVLGNKVRVAITAAFAAMQPMGDTQKKTEPTPASAGG